ncbi:coagulation factor V [Elysia marginata]|uniref:Coagulation factor V n=1 Tax=Elysia marginata TaxID=1093978 RepID=A0AAV4ILD8_9GAST|nr:coagulation factor V [Elysia marginata]
MLGLGLCIPNRRATEAQTSFGPYCPYQTSRVVLVEEAWPLWLSIINLKPQTTQNPHCGDTTIIKLKPQTTQSPYCGDTTIIKLKPQTTQNPHCGDTTIIKLKPQTTQNPHCGDTMMPFQEPFCRPLNFK